MVHLLENKNDNFEFVIFTISVSLQQIKLLIGTEN